MTTPPNRLGADRVAFAGCHAGATRHHIALHIRGIERNAADRHDTAHQVDATPYVGARQAQRVACVAMRDARSWRRGAKPRAASKQVAIDHGGMHIEPRLGIERRKAGEIERPVQADAARADLAGAAPAQAQPCQAGAGQIERRRDLAALQRQRGKPAAGGTGAAGEIQRALEPRAAYAHTGQTDRPWSRRGGQAEQQMAQEGGADYRSRRFGKGSDLAQRHASEHLGFGFEQACRVEPWHALFVGHSGGTLEPFRAGWEGLVAASGAFHPCHCEFPTSRPPTHLG